MVRQQDDTLGCTGDEMMRHLLLHTSMFTRLDNDCLLQVCVCVCMYRGGLSVRVGTRAHPHTSILQLTGRPMHLESTHQQRAKDAGSTKPPAAGHATLPGTWVYPIRRIMCVPCASGFVARRVSRQVWQVFRVFLAVLWPTVIPHFEPFGP